jgi:hypothetical protein
MGMYFVSNQSQPRSQFRGGERTRQVTQPVVAPPTTLTTLTTLQAAPIAQQSEPLAQQSVAQSTSSIITRTRARPNTSRFNMNDTFASRGRPCG